MPSITIEEKSTNIISTNRFLESMENFEYTGLKFDKKTTYLQKQMELSDFTILKFLSGSDDYVIFMTS